MRIDKQPVLQPFVGDASHDRRAGSVTIAVRLSLRIDQNEVARANNPAQQQVEQSIHGAKTASVRFLVSVRPIPAGSTRFQYKV